MQNYELKPLVKEIRTILGTREQEPSLSYETRKEIELLYMPCSKTIH